MNHDHGVLHSNLQCLASELQNLRFALQSGCALYVDSEAKSDLSCIILHRGDHTYESQWLVVKSQHPLDVV